MKKKLLSYIVCIFHKIAYNNAKTEIKKKIDKDIMRYEENYSLQELLFMNSNFRTVFYYRIRGNKFFDTLLPMILKPNKNIEIHVPNGNIGGGLRIFHNYGCVLSAKQIGENCTILQGVTIGNGKKTDIGTNPVIGNNVIIHANAVVFGGISIGDNVIIGANTSVYRDVADNMTVVGDCRILSKKEMGD